MLHPACGGRLEIKKNSIIYSGNIKYTQEKTE